MSRFSLLLLIALNLCGFSFAKSVAVLETAADSTVKNLVSFNERQYLTNVLREKAIKVFHADRGWIIMTRENINVLLPAGKSIEDCEGSCLAETGRNISADYVAQAKIAKFGSGFSISAELYSTRNSKFVANFTAFSTTVDGLVSEIEEKAPGFFNKVLDESYENASGIGDLRSENDFKAEYNKLFVVRVVTRPAGAKLKLDGYAHPKCKQTPCQIQVEPGNHLFGVARDENDLVEIEERVYTNEQIIVIDLKSNTGKLVVNPRLLKNVGSVDDLDIEIDGHYVRSGEYTLYAGKHNLMISHPCYEKVSYDLNIEKGKVEFYEKELDVQKGKLYLTADNNEGPQSLAVFVDGAFVGNTPFKSVLPICSKVAVGDALHQDTIPVKIVPNASVNYNYFVEKSLLLAMEKTDSLLEARDKKSIGESVRSFAGHKIKTRKLALEISTAILLSGAVLALAMDSRASDLQERKTYSNDDNRKRLNKLETAQSVRKIGIGVAIAGAVGFVLNIAF